MGKKKDVNTLRTSRELIAYAARKGCDVIPGKGSHVKVKNARGFAVIPNHPGELPAGTRRSIIKVFMAMGIAVLLVLLLLTRWVHQTVDRADSMESARFR